MTSARRKELRLAAWRSFRGIARASRTLAAAQSMHWAEHSRRVSRYRKWCARLAAAYGVVPASDAAPRTVVAIGTDLGLCGPLNPRVARVLDARDEELDAQVIVVGHRLAVEVSRPVDVILPAPTSFEAIEAVSAQLGSLVDERTALHIVVTSAVEADGRTVVGTWDDPTPADLEPLPSVLDLTDVDAARTQAAALLRHARIASALTRGATSEAEARWRAMSRAHDAADRRIGEQERDLRRMRQESITQEMLEVRRKPVRLT